jgi:hypothetical protein
MIFNTRVVLVLSLALAAACSATDTPSTPPPISTQNPMPTPTLRPGEKDSSKSFQGTASPNETSFWEAVRKGDDAARAKAVEGLKKDVAVDPKNAYSAFLAGANVYMPPSGLLLALNAGQVPEGGEQQALPPDTIALFTNSMNTFTDPLLKGFAASLLSATQAGAGDFEASGKSMEIAIANNIPASSVTRAIGSLLQRDLKGAYEVIWQMMDFCAGAPLDRANPDVDTYVDRANRADLRHRECYSGYHAMHGTEGTLLLAGDLAALNGNASGAAKMYAGMKRSTNYGTWGLRNLAERRISGYLKAVPENMFNISACTSCHVDQIK